MFATQAHNMLLFKRVVTLVVLFFFLFQEVGRAQLSGRSQTVQPFNPATTLNEQNFIDQEAFQSLESRELYLNNRTESLNQIQLDSTLQNQLLIEQQSQLLRDVMAIQKLNQQQTSQQLESQAAQIQSQMDSAGERYILYDDGKKVTFKAGRTLRIENETVPDKLGNLSKRDTLDMQYNDEGQLISYDQKTTDSSGNLTTVQWRQGTYWTSGDQQTDSRKVAGKLSGYIETISEPTGRVSTRTWQNLHYYTETDEQANPAHVAGQLSQYRVETVGNDAPAAPRVTELSEAKYERRAATQTEFDSSEEEDVLLVSFHEKSTVLGVTTERDFFNGTYNEHEQLVSYDEVSTTLGVTTTKEWRNGTYDSLGQLTGFREVTETDGVVTVREFQNAQYNVLGQLISYTEVVETQGVTRTTQFGGASYDQFGRLSAFENLITENGITFTQARSDIEYNDQGLVTGYLDVVDREGVITETRRSNITYDAFGRTFSYQDQIREVANGEERTFRLIREFTDYNSLSQQTGYKDTLFHANGLVQEITRTNIAYNALGQIIRFFEIIKESGSIQQAVPVLDTNGNVVLDANGQPVTQIETIAVNRHTSRSYRNAQYDALGRVIAYEEEVIDLTRPATTLIRQRSNITYDANNRVASFKEIETKTGPNNLNEVILREKQNIIYDALGRELAFFERVTDPTGTVTERTFSNAVYDALGNLVSYEEVVTVNGETVTRKREQIVRDGLGRILSFIETTVDLFGVKTVRHRKTTQYNQQDEEIGFEETVTRSGNGTNQAATVIALQTQESVKRFDVVYNAAGQLVGYKEERIDLLGVQSDVEFKDALYDAQGRLTEKVEIVHRHGTDAASASMKVLDILFTRHTKNIAYNAGGQETGYEEVITYQDGIRNFVQTTQREASTYNAQKQLVTFKETLTSTAEPNKTIVKERLATTYNSKNVLDSSEELLSELGVDGNGNTVLTKKSRTIRNGIAYDGLGREYSFVESVALEGGSSLTLSTQRLETSYNALNQVTSSKEKLTRSDAPSLEITKTLSSVVYNSFGFRQTFSELIEEKGGAVHTLRLKNRLATSYNKIGTEIGFTEETQALSLPGGNQVQAVLWKETVVKSSVTLDNFGREAAYTETLTDRFGNTRTRQRSGIAYNSLGQETGYQETRTFFNFSETETRSNITYDLQGRLFGFAAQLALTAAGQDASGNPINLQTTRSITRALTLYNTQDQVISTKETEISSEAPELAVTVERSAVTYNSVGLLLGYVDTLTQKNTAASAQVRDVVVVVSRQGIQYTVAKELLSYVETITRSSASNETETVTFQSASYDAFSRLLGFIEKRQSSLVTESVTRTRSNMAYDARNRLVTFSESIVREGTDAANQAFQATQTRSRTQTVYNTLDQVLSFNEDLVSSEEPKNLSVQYSQAQYNTQGQLLSFKQERFLPNATLFDSVARVQTEYNAFGEVVRTVQKERSITESNLEIEVELKDILFDSLGRQIGFTQILKQLSIAPGPVSFNLTTTRQRSNVAFNNDGRVTGYQEASSSTAEPGVSTTTTISGIAYNAIGAQSAFVQQVVRQDSQGNLLVNSRLERTQIQTDFLGRLQSYQEEFQADGQATLTTTRSNIVTNNFGQVMGYQEQGVSQSGETFQLTRSNIVYNAFGLVDQYEESGVRSTEGVVAVKRLATTYNSLGFVIQYNEERTVAGSTTAINRQNITYNSLGQLLSYTETRVDLAFPALVETIQFSGASYDSKGRLEQFTQTRSVTGSTFTETTVRTQTLFNATGQVIGFTEEKTRAGTDAAGNSISVVETVTRDKVVYSSSGLVASFEETSQSALFTAPRKRIFSNAVYNASAQLVSFKEERFEGTQLLSERIRQTTLFDAQGRVSGFTESEKPADTADLEVTTTLSDIVYNAQGLQESFKQTQVFANKLTQTNQTASLTRTQITYDTLGRLTGYKDNGVGVDGVSFEIVRSAIAYDLNSDVAGYTEVTTRQTGEQSTLVRSNIQTNLLGEVIGYEDRLVQSAQPDVEVVQVATQIQTNLFGRQTSIQLQTQRISKISGAILSTLNVIRSNMVYNSVGQLISYREVSSGTQQAQVTVDRSQILYNEKGQIVSFTETGTNSQSGSFQLTRQNMQYDLLGRLIAYEETGTSGGTGPYTLNRSNITYNLLGQETGYVEQGTTSQGAFQRNRSNITYNTLGQITGYQETQTSAQAPDETIQAVFRDAVYNAQGQLISFVQERNFQVRQLSEVVERQSTQYDAQGRVIGFTEVQTRDTVVTTVTRSNVVHNAQDLVLSYEELRQIQGVAEARKIFFSQAVYDAESRLVQFQQEIRLASNNTLLEKRVRVSTTFNANGQVIGSAETIVSGASPNVTTTQTLSNIAYDGVGRQVSYDQITLVQELSAQGAVLNLDHTTSLTRSQITYNGLGQVTGYQEVGNTSDSGNFNRVRSNIAYNKLGQETGFTENLTNAQGSTQSTRQAITYNLSGQVVSYTEERVVPEAPNNTLTILFKEATYTVFGQLLTFVQERSSTSSLVTETITRLATTYNSLGQVSGFTESKLQQGQDASGNQVSVLQQSVRSNITYNQVGQLLGYQEDIDSNVTTIKQRRLFSHAVYDASGRLIQFKETLSDRDTGTLLNQRERTQTTYDAAGRLIGSTEISISGGAPDVQLTTQLTGITYDGVGRQTAFTRTVQRQSTQGAALNVTTTLERSAIVYNGLGQVISYHDKTSGSELPLIEFDRTQIVYNSLGQLLSYQDQGVHQINGNFTITQTNRQYNSKGELVGFDEEAVSDGQGESVRKRSNIVTNLFGQETAYKEERFLKQGGSLTLIATVERSAIAYNALGQLSNYVELSTAPSAPSNQIQTTFSEATYDGLGRLLGSKRVIASSASQITQTLLRTQTTYNSFSQIIGYQETRTQAGQLASGQQLNIVQNVTRSDVQFNNLGQLVHYKETISDNIVAFARVIEFSQAVYDVKGRLTQFLESSTRADNNQFLSSRKRLVTEFSALNQVVRSLEEIRTASEPDLVSTVEVKDVLFDANGNQVGFTQITTKNSTTATSFALVSEFTRSSIVRNNLGQVTSYHEVGTSNGNPAFDLDRSNIVYDGLGQVLSYQESGSRAGSGQFQVTRSAIQYDSSGRVASYNEVGQTQATGSFNLARTQIAYNDFAQVTGFVEAGRNNQGDFSRTRSQQLYNGFGLLLSYQEISTTPRAPGEAITTVVTHSSYDAQGRLIGFEQVRTRISSNLVERTVRTQTTYDAANLINGFTETRTQTGTDSQGNPIQIQIDVTRDQVVQNALGQVASYREQILSSAVGFPQTLIFSNGTYDSQARLVSFKEVISHGTTGAFLSQRERTVTEFDAQGRVTRTVELTRSAAELNIQTTQETNNIAYDTFERQVSFTQVTTRQSIDPTTGALLKDASGNTIIDLQSTLNRSQIQYNTLGQVISYQESLNGPGQPSIQRARDQITYDGLGRLSGFREQGNSQVRGGFAQVRSNMQYNTQGQLIAYQDQFQDEVDGIRTVQRSATTYNSVGQVTAFTETLTNKNGTVTTTRQAIVTNAFGVVTSYTDSVVRSAAPSETETLQFVAGNFDSLGRLLNFTQTKTKTSSGLTEMQTRSAIQYNSAGQVLSYQDAIVRQGTLNGQPLQINETVARTNITYTAQGNVAGYEDVITSSTTSLTRQVTLENAVYDSLGNRLTFKETTTLNGTDASGNAIQVVEVKERLSTLIDANGRENKTVEKTVNSLQPQIETFTTTSNIVYNSNGLREQFTQAVRRVSLNQSIDFTLTVARTSTTYNGLGEPVGFVQSTTSSVSPDLSQTITRTNTVRNEFGLVTGFDESILTVGVGKATQLAQQTRVQTTYTTDLRVATRNTTLDQQEIDAAGNVVEDFGRIQLAKSAISYDLLGNELGFTESKTDSRLPGETSLRTFSRQANLAGETLSSVDNTKRLDLQGNLLIEQEVRQTNLAYNSVGQLTGFDQQVWQSDLATMVLGQVAGITRSQMAYNSLNQLTGYQETGFTAQDGNFQLTRSQMLYNSLGQLASFRDQGSSSINGPFSFDRTQIETNFLNQVTAYHEAGQNSKGNYRIEREQVKYNALNQITDYLQREYLEQAPDEILTTLFAKAVYDLAGRMLTFERTRSTVSSQLVEKTVRLSSTYNNQNLVSGYQETVTQSGVDELGTQVNIVRQVTRSNITYNAQREMTGYQETVTSNVSTLTVSVVFSNGLYDASRRLVSFTEVTRTTGTLPSGAVVDNTSTRVRLTTEYNAENRVTRFVEKLTQSTQPNFETTLTTEAIAYDALGRQTQFNQTSVRTHTGTGVSLTSTLVRLQTTYDTFGRILTFTQEQTDPQSPAITRVLQRSSTQYNQLGQIKTIEEVQYEKGRGPSDAVEGVVQTSTKTFTYNELLQTKTEQSTVTLASNLSGLYRTISTLRNAIAYDLFGNQVQFTETTTHSDFAGETSQRQFQAEYNAQNQIFSFTETVTRTDGAGNLISTQTTSRSQMVYNSDGQVLSYEEVNEGTDLLKTKTVRTGLTYSNLGQVTAFTEQILNLNPTTPVVISTRTRSAITYNGRGEVLGYTEVGQNPEQGNFQSTRSQQTFDYRGRLTGYVESFIVDGITTTTTRSNTQFNARDLAISYTETSQNSVTPTEIQTTEFSNGMYDALNRLFSFVRRKSSNQSEYVEVVTRSSTTYNSIGKVASSVENRNTLAQVTGQPGQLELLDERNVTRDRTIYNDLGQLISYDEVSDRTGLNNTLELSVGLDRTTTLFRNAVYDANGRLLSFSETETREINGSLVDQPRIRNWTRETNLSSELNVRDQWSYIGDTVQIANNELVWDNTGAGNKTLYMLQSASMGETQGYTVEISLQLEDVSTPGSSFVLFFKGSEYGKIFRFKDGVIEDVQENKSYAANTTDAMHTYRFVVKNNQIQIFQDGVLLATDGMGTYKFSGFQEPINIANTDARVRIGSFRYFTGDGVPPSSTPRAFSQLLSVQRTRTNSYDAQGRLSESVEVSTSSVEPDLQVTTTTNQISYDAQNRQTGFTQTTLSESTDPATPLNIISTQVRSAVTYDSQNRITSYHDEFSSTATPDVSNVVDRTNITYTARDQIASFDETVQEIYAGGNTYITEQQVERTYTNTGNLNTEITYERQTASNELISVTRRTKTDVVVDPLGVEVHSVVREEDLTEVYQATEYNAALRQFGSQIAAVNPVNPLATQYDNYEFINNGTFLGDGDNAYITQGGTITLNLTQAVDASKILLGFYNAANQKGAAYKVEVSSDGVNFTTVAQNSITENVNPYSHEVTFAQQSVKAIRFTVTQGVNFGGGPLFNISEIQLLTARGNAGQQGIQLSNNQNVKDQIQNLDALGLAAKYVTSTRTTNTTNALGQIVGQVQIRNKTFEGVLIETVKVARSDQVFNRLGLVESYKEETSTVMTTWLSFQNLYFSLTTPLPLSVNHRLYNFIGTPQSFDYNGHGHFVGLGHLAATQWDIFQSTDRTNITYNDKAQVTGYQESGVARPFGGTYSLTRTNMQYNTKGELIAFTETGQTQASGSYSFTRDQIVYASTQAVVANQTQIRADTLISFHEVGTNPQDGQYEYSRVINAFDGRGRPTDIQESGTKNGFAYNYHRTNIKYNVNELANSWNEQGLLRGVTYDIVRHMTRYNNMGQETDRFEEGTRAGAHFFEIVSNVAYDFLGRFFKSGTRSGTTNYNYTFDGTRAFTFYDAEGRVSAYQNYFGPVFVDVTNIQYDAQGRIVGYTETTRGGGTKVVFNITFDSAGRIISQQFTDTSLKLRFGNVSTQTFTYDEKTGKLLEFKIENNDFIATFDGKGNRKSFELSAQMKAFIEEEQRKAVEAAKRRAQKEAAKENKKLISRKEIIENAKGNKKLKRLLDTLPKDKKGQIQLGDAEIEFLLRKSKTFRKFVLRIGISKQQLKAVLNSSIRAAGRVIAVSVGAIRESVAGKILATIKEAIKARAPNLTGEEILAATLVKRIEEVFEVTDEQGRVHRVTEITRLDGNGNQIERIVIDKFTFRNEKGKKVKAQIVSIFDSQDRLTRVGETYKQKKKKGTLITKRTTVFDPETGEIISTKTKQKFERKRSFGSILGATLTFGLPGAILSAIDPDAIPKFLESDLGKVFRIAATAAAALTGNPFIIAATQFSLSLAAGNDFGDAFKAAGISLAAFIVTAGIADFLTGIDPGALGGLGETLNAFGNNIAQTLQPGQFDLARFGLQVGIKAAGEEFSNKLGAFGTVAAISLASALVGQIFSAGGNPTGFDPSFFGAGSILLRAAAQGGIAEAFKNENGLGAQFAQGVAGNVTGGLSTGVLGGIGKQFGSFAQGIGNIFNSLTENPSSTLALDRTLRDNNFKPGLNFLDENGNVVLSVELNSSQDPRRFALNTFNDGEQRITIVNLDNNTVLVRDVSHGKESYEVLRNGNPVAGAADQINRQGYFDQFDLFNTADNTFLKNYLSRNDVINKQDVYQILGNGNLSNIEKFFQIAQIDPTFLIQGGVETSIRAIDNIGETVLANNTGLIGDTIIPSLPLKAQVALIGRESLFATYFQASFNGTNYDTAAKTAAIYTVYGQQLAANQLVDFMIGLSVGTADQLIKINPTVYEAKLLNTLSGTKIGSFSKGAGVLTFGFEALDTGTRVFNTFGSGNFTSSQKISLTTLEVTRGISSLGAGIAGASVVAGLTPGGLISKSIGGVIGSNIASNAVDDYFNSHIYERQLDYLGRNLGFE